MWSRIGWNYILHFNKLRVIEISSIEKSKMNTALLSISGPPGNQSLTTSLSCFNFAPSNLQNNHVFTVHLARYMTKDSVSYLDKQTNKYQ